MFVHGMYMWSLCYCITFARVTYVECEMEVNLKKLLHSYCAEKKRDKEKRVRVCVHIEGMRECDAMCCTFELMNM